MCIFTCIYNQLSISAPRFTPSSLYISSLMQITSLTCFCTILQTEGNKYITSNVKLTRVILVWMYADYSTHRCACHMIWTRVIWQDITARGFMVLIASSAQSGGVKRNRKSVIQIHADFTNVQWYMSYMSLMMVNILLGKGRCSNNKEDTHLQYVFLLFKNISQ